MFNYSKVNSLLFNQSAGDDYVEFSNADKKTWLLPQKNMRTALNIYQPSGIRGKLLKQLLPIFKTIKYFQKSIKLEFKSITLKSNFTELLNNVFKTNNIEYSIFGGTPSKHQKATIQLFKKKQIIGYCKFSDNVEIKSIFRHEQKVLDYLQNLEVKNVPSCLYRDTIIGETDVFIQSTLKTNKSRVTHKWTDEHWFFLRNLRNKTKQKIPFEQTDFFNTLLLLESNSTYLVDSDKSLVLQTIEEIRMYYQNNNYNFSLYHGDFTPWNTFAGKDGLYVFDFEYSRLSYPQYLDYFHFITQISIFEKGYDANKIFKSFLRNKKYLSNYFDHLHYAYTSYLLDIISLYLERDKGVYTSDTTKCLNIWFELLKLLQK